MRAISTYTEKYLAIIIKYWKKPAKKNQNNQQFAYLFLEFVGIYILILIRQGLRTKLYIHKSN